jgi:transcriptional regulator with XRE-family HTH domain
VRFDGNKVRQARERLGRTMEMVGQEADVSKNSILRAEHGGDIRPVTARKIAQALGVEVVDLVEEPTAPKARTSLSLQDEQRRSNEIDRWLAYANFRAWAWEEQAEKEESPLFEHWRTAVEWDSEVTNEAFELIRIIDEDLWTLIGAGTLNAPEAQQAERLMAAVDRLWAAYKKANARTLAVVASMREAVRNTASLARARGAAEQRAEKVEGIVEDIKGRRSA